MLGLSSVRKFEGLFSKDKVNIIFELGSGIFEVEIVQFKGDYIQNSSFSYRR